MVRRDLMRLVPAGAMLGATGMLTGRADAAPAEREKPPAPRGLPPLKITDVATILTAPDRIRLVVVKVLDQRAGPLRPGLRHVHAAGRWRSQTAVDKYLKPFLIGRDPDEIEDIWQSSYVSSYWRNGPVLFNAMSGVDMALWDIKGKRAGMPVYQLLGGQVPVRRRALRPRPAGATPRRSRTASAQAMAKGYRHVRVQVAIPGLATYGAAADREPSPRAGAERADQPEHVWEPARYVRRAPRSCSSTCGRSSATTSSCSTTSTSGSRRARRSSSARTWSSTTRSSSRTRSRPRRTTTSGSSGSSRATPIAMGELFNTQHEYVPLIAEPADRLHPHPHLADRRPEHGAEGGRPGEFFGVKTAWHGPGDVSPVGHAAGLRWSWPATTSASTRAASSPTGPARSSPAAPRPRTATSTPTRRPGLGIDIDEKLAAKFPFPDSPTFDHRWGTTRRRDGTVIRPCDVAVGSGCE